MNPEWRKAYFQAASVPRASCGGARPGGVLAAEPGRVQGDNGRSVNPRTALIQSVFRSAARRRSVTSASWEHARRAGD